MALIVMPSLLSKRPWARIRARCEASFFIVFSKSVRCCSVRGSTYLTLIDLESGCTYHIVWELQREILYQKTFGLALTTRGSRIYLPNQHNTSTRIFVQACLNARSGLSDTAESEVRGVSR